MSNSKSERRAYPRAEGSFPVTVRGKEFTLITEAKNISCSGLYCTTNKSIPLNTEVAVTLLLNKYLSSKMIGCKGKVVRVDLETVGNVLTVCGIIIYFAELNKRDRNNISNYVNLWLKRNADVIIKYE